ncbi:hypothetical protein ALC56_01138 [Trachymyrmex septentrionalis]|uniref:Uncharacterized protein n=1 Tax=Trachymyrmex septentrionalis TaxID=34720 RepID=A0A195FUW3_9HYME|nr:hypothetical protein ALC56_01138 [Trachymyrmex septentrionalis]
MPLMRSPISRRLSSSGREFLHRRPSLIINVISRGSVLSQGEKEREKATGEGCGERGKTTSPGRHKGGTVPLNFRKAQEYSSAVEKRICVTPRKKIELVRSAKEMSRISKMHEMYFCKMYAFIEVSK